MRASTCAALLLAGVASAVCADTLPSRQLVLDYIAAAGIPDAMDKTASIYGKDIAAKGFPGGEDRVNELLASTIAWSAMKEDYISLIQRTYTPEELTAMIAFARSPVGAGIAAKNQQFVLAASEAMMKKVQLLASMMSAEASPTVVAMDKPSKHLERQGITYVVPPSPVYPAESRARGEEGVVKLYVLVGSSGVAEAVGVRESSGFPRLDEAALAALAQAKFRPYVQNGVPTKAYAPATLTFQLDNGDESKQSIPFKKKLF